MPPKKKAEASVSRKRQKIFHNEEPQSPKKLSVAEQRKRAAEWAERQGYNKPTPDKKRRISSDKLDIEKETISSSSSQVVEAGAVLKFDDENLSAEENQKAESELPLKSSPEVSNSSNSHDSKIKIPDAPMHVSTADDGYWSENLPMNMTVSPQRQQPRARAAVEQNPIGKLTLSDLNIPHVEAQPPLATDADHTAQAIEDNSTAEADHDGHDAGTNEPLVADREETIPPTVIPTNEETLQEEPKNAAETVWAERSAGPGSSVLQSLHRVARIGVVVASVVGLFVDFELGLGALFVAVKLGLIRRLVAQLRQ